LLLYPGEQGRSHVFAVVVGRAGAFSVKAVSCDGDALLPGLALGVLYGCVQHLTVIDPVQILDVAAVGDDLHVRKSDA